MSAVRKLRARVSRATARRRAEAAIANSGLFDPQWYAEQAGIGVDQATIAHYLEHGEAQGTDPHPLFDVRWYRQQVKGGARSALGPFAHFLRRGAPRGDRPHPIFDRDWYLAKAPDAVDQPGGMLGHYVREGSAGGIEPAPWIGELLGETSPPGSSTDEPLAVTIAKRHDRRRRAAGPDEEAARSFTEFDRSRERRLLREVVDPWRDARWDDQPLVSIILPTHDRADSIGRAVSSVLAQSYDNWELIVADDGSRDATASVVASFGDDRIHYLPLQHGGVCWARNEGLRSASGRYVAYLDSDNAWEPRFLEVMVAFLDSSGHEASHCALRYVEDGVTYYRGVEVPREQLLLRNFIDCNTLVHRRELAERIGGWDEQLRRTNDWDYVLRLSAATRIAYVPYVGVDYEHDRRRSDRITVREPVGYRMKVRERHLLDWDATGGVTPAPGSVAVVIVAEAEFEIVEGCVRSVLESVEGIDVRVVVVDAGDNINESLRLVALELLDARVDVIRIVGEAHRVLPRNAGFLATDAETVVFLSSEVRVLEGWLQPLLDALDDGAAAAQPKVVTHSGEVLSTGYLIPEAGLPYLAWAGSPESASWVEAPAQRRALSHDCLVVRSATLRELRGFDAMFLSMLFDVDLCLRLQREDRGSLRYVPTSLVARQFVRRGRIAGRHGVNDQRVFEARWNRSGPSDEAQAFGEVGLEVARRERLPPERTLDAGVYAPVLRLPDTADRPLRWAIKIAARDIFVRGSWGDWHFASALKTELERLGHQVVIDLYDAWYRPTSHLDDVVLCLRGVRRYHPNPDHVNLMWLISHPEDVEVAEYERYDRVLVASTTYAEEVAAEVHVPVEPLLQCTDPSRFRPLDVDEPGPAALFVGNSRMILRPIVRDAISDDLPIEIVGDKWDHLVPERLVRASFVPNEQLAELYCSAGVVLNDHWADMRRRGFLSNRLFDLAACAVPIVSDEIAGLDEIFGPVVRTYGGERPLREVVEEAWAVKESEREARLELATTVAEQHSFAARAAHLSAVVPGLASHHR